MHTHHTDQASTDPVENIVIYADAQRAPTPAILSILISQTSTRGFEFGRFKEPNDSIRVIEFSFSFFFFFLAKLNLRTEKLSNVNRSNRTEETSDSKTAGGIKLLEVTRQSITVVCSFSSFPSVMQ